ncbi:MAG: HAD family hydrolase, partial [Paracoccaceae bacterium]
MKIAMWSGPRNLSTAMMYSFGNRPDFQAWDEPFYAAYLMVTGIDHPLRDEVLAEHDSDPHAVSNKIREASGNLYMKHMGFQMEPDFPMDWAEDCVNIHLIRHPARVVASYAAKRENPTMRDIGFEQQVDVFDLFPGPVIDSADVRRDPKGMIQRLCAEIGLAFDASMLNWPAGPKDFDGAWAPHWYNAVHKSTGFAGDEGPLPEVSGKAASLV